MPESIPEPKRGDNIRTWATRVTIRLNRLVNLLAIDGTSGLEIVGSSLRVTRGGKWTTGAKTPAGGIPAKTGNTPGSAVCTFYVWDGTSDILGTRTETVRNRWPAAFAGNRDIEVYWDQGSWWVSVQSCT